MTNSLLRIQSARFGLMLLCLLGYSINGISQIDFQEIREIPGPFPDMGHIRSADLDGDGDLDFLVMGQTITNTVVMSTHLYRNEGNGNFTYVENTPFAGSIGGAAVFGDVDSDNDLDVVIVGYENVVEGGTGTGNLYLNDGAGNFTIAPSNPFPGVFASTAKFFDFNGDAHLDLFLTGLIRSTSSPVVGVFIGDGNGNFQEVFDHGLQAFSWPTFNVGDVDGDGDEDVIEGGIRGNTRGTFIFSREGDRYVRAQFPFTPIHGGASELADFDKDGDLDYVIFGKDFNHSAEYWKNDGAGNFSKVDHPFIKISEHPNLVVQDFDFDDDLDIYLGSTANYLVGNNFYFNDGNGNFTIHNFNSAAPIRMGSGAGDFDGKGLVDVIEFRRHEKTEPSKGMIYINNIDLNEPPSVTAVDITGRFLVGFDISSDYIFVDEDGDEDQSSFQWFRADDALGTNKIQIENANEKKYTTIGLDEAKFLSVEITPFDGTAAGAAVQSPFVGPIEQPQPRLALSGNSIHILDGTLETSLENHTDFGQIEYGGQLSRAYIMKNEGEADLVISEISITGASSNEFYLQDFMPVTLSTGMQATLTVYFQASGLGRRSAEIEIATNQQGTPFIFGISGTGLNLPPVFNSISTTEYIENGTQPVLDVNASNGEGGSDDEHIEYTLSGGEDSGLFNINSSGQLSFISSPDFENPGDANMDNQYRLEVIADDGELLNHSTVQQISISVTNLDEFPVANCKRDLIVYLDENGMASLNASDLDNGSTDDLEIIGMSAEPNTFHCSDLGERTVIFTVLDSGGNTNSCQTTIRVADNIKPVIFPVSVIVTENDPGKCEATIEINPPRVVDNCEVLTATGQRSDNLSLEAAFPIGSTTITWNATGAEEVIQVVNVLDADAPIFGTIPTIEVSTDLGSSGAVLIIPTPEISDCGTVNILGSRSDGLPLQNRFPVGETTITWTATDGTNTAVPGVQKIMVRDNEPPKIEGPSNLTISSEAGNCGILVAITPPDVTDNCKGIIQVIGVREDQKSLEDLFPVGVTKIRWNAVDVHNNPALEVTQTVTVEERGSGEITFTGPEGPMEIGVRIPMAAHFTDENIVSATWTALDGNLSVHESFTEPLSKGIGTSAYTFENLSPGVYTVRLDLEHECGTVSSKVFEYVVIYDPNGGFVTGGGWIISPEGAMKDPGMQMTSGIANFGFNAKYKNGKNEVNEVGGETNFQFKAGDLHFKSSSHQAMSLVVSGGFKATYKGAGALNGEPGFDFMVTVIDAAESENHPTDLFRIKISKGNRVIYDNNVLINAENADPATAIGGGSIVIHKPKGPKTKVQVAANSEEDPAKDELETFSAYPNPMEGEAIIEFSLSTTTAAVLSLYDLNGREVLALFSGKVEAGRIYEIEISNRNLMQGIYIYRLTTESGRAYQKQLMVK